MTKIFLIAVCIIIIIALILFPLIVSYKAQKKVKKKIMFGEFLSIIVRSIKLDKTLYKDNKNFGEAAIYFAGIIMILDGIAGAVAANTIIKTAIAMSGLTAILHGLFGHLFIFVIGVKLFPDKETKIPFKKVLIGVGLLTAPGLLRFFAVTPDLMMSNNFS